MATEFFGSLGNGFAAATEAELGRKLAEIDTSVPPRTQGRRSAHRERYCVVHYLRTLVHNGLLRFPFHIEKAESPDFRVKMVGRNLGLEVTDAGSPEFQRSATALEHAPPGSLLVGTAVRSPGEPLKGLPYVGDEPERLWTADLLAAIEKKTKQLPAYLDLLDDHLLIYDNSEFAVLTAWTVTELPSRLAAALLEKARSEPSVGRRFSRISVLRDRVLMYDVTGDAFVLPVPTSPSLPPLFPLTRLGVEEDDLRAFCRRHAVRKLGFFGSVRGDRFGEASDVDVLVEFEPGTRMGLLHLAGIELELSRLLGRKADLRTVPDLSRYFRDQVVRERTDVAYAYAAAG